MSKCAFSIWNVNFFIKTLMCLSHSKNIYLFPRQYYVEVFMKAEYNSLCMKTRKLFHGIFQQNWLFCQTNSKTYHNGLNFPHPRKPFSKNSLLLYWLGHFGRTTNFFIFPDKQDSGRMTYWSKIFWDLFKL